MGKKLRLILGDQLNHEHSWFKQRSSDTCYLIAELPQEATYVAHHVQKVAAFFLAMESFANHLKSQGHQVIYLTLDETSRYRDLPELLQALIKQHEFEFFEYQRPDEYRLLCQLREADLPTEVSEYDSEHFLLPFDEINVHFKPRKHKKMEFFYRYMRKRFNILMKNDKPLGEQWNFDAENRQTLKSESLDIVPEPLVFNNSIKTILKRIKKYEIKVIGHCSDDILWPINRQQALQLLEYFCEQCLINFGRYQDAMVNEYQFGWSLFHSRLSFAINCKLLSPREVIETAVNYYQSNKKLITLAQIEGFVRQILGWREYVRGVYWANMPDYAQLNQLAAKRKLPDFFWNGKTKMNCMSHAINQSLDYAYAHHIHRLMVTGNFSLLTELDVDQVDEWYLGIYIDAIEWVELPNTRGMALFADEGIVATKPYAASGNYINKMSDYCGSCTYNVKRKNEDDACPFNSLYWRFMDRHRDKLSVNPRIGMIYRNWDKQSEASRQQTLDRAEWIINNIEDI
ncbi:cryptochrome/photolyase family protein [Aliikangiella marina]|nr:cryptochrome/photolyase family protein [Aliikangiella marina]